jgi:hypothetical protein
MSSKMMHLRDITGKTIHAVEVIRTESWRTHDTYICITFTDTSKIMLCGVEPYEPNPDIDEMKKAPNYFSPQDIANKLLRLERERQLREKNELDRKTREFERLKQELSILKNKDFTL